MRMPQNLKDKTIQVVKGRFALSRDELKACIDDAHKAIDDNHKAALLSSKVIQEFLHEKHALYACHATRNTLGFGRPRVYL
jgi:hypothetical protein